MKNIFIYVVVGVITFFYSVIKILAISNIEIPGYSLSPLFDSNVYTYNVYVNNINNLNINVIKENNDKEVYYEETIELKEEYTETTISVLKEDNTSYEYKIRVFKNYEVSNDFGSSSLLNLELDGYDIDFRPNVYNYSINIEEDITFLKIDYEVLSELSQVTIKGNKSLNENNNIITITVLSFDKNNKTIYTINANKVKTVFNESEDEEKNIFNRSELTSEENRIIIIVIISIGFILIMFIMYLLFFIGDKKVKNTKKSKKGISHGILQK